MTMMENIKANAIALEKLVDRAVASENFEMAQLYIRKRMEHAIKKLHSSEVRQVRARYSEFEDSLIELNKISKLYKKAVQKLEAKPNDKTANCRVGDYYFFLQDDLDRAELYWAKSNSPMNKISLRWIETKATPDAMGVRGDAWFEMAKNYKGFMLQKVVLQAKVFYVEAEKSSRFKTTSRAAAQLQLISEYLEQMMVLSAKEKVE